MKSTKLLTCIVALALVLGLGACSEPEEEDVSSEDNEPTSSETTTEDNTSEETTSEGTSGGTSSEDVKGPDYAIVGDFADANWNNEPEKTSDYFIPAGTEHVEITVTIAEEPDYGTNDEGEANDPWDAGLRVVEYGTWTLAIGSDNLDEDSTGVIGSDNEKNIKVEWGATYKLSIDFGETNSILLKEIKEIEDNTITEMLSAIDQDCNYNATSYYLLYMSDDVAVDERSSDLIELVQGYATDVYATEDAIEIDYLVYTTGNYGTGWYYMDFEIYANDYETNETIVYYYSNYVGFYEYTRLPGLWKDNIYSLADLVDYRWAFTLSSSYLGYEQYNVDETALDMLINTTVGNSYIWNDLFTTGGGWGDQYFGYPDYVSASDIYYGTQADAYGLFTGYQIVEFIFDEGGWYYTDGTRTEVFYQEVEAYTDVYLDSLGEIDIASLWED